MIHFRRIFTTILLTYSICAGLDAQVARLYDSQSGLPNTQISDVIQDSDGLVWVATSNGLFRYDGVRFQAFHPQSRRENSLASDLVLKVFEDSRGVIWVGSSKALQIFDPDDNAFTRFALDGDDTTNHVYSMDEVSLGNGRSGILVSSSGDGLFLIDADTHEVDEALHEKFLQPDNSLHFKKIFVDSKSRIWASSEMGGLYVFGSGGEIILDEIWDGTDPSLQKTVLATAFAENEATGNIFIGTANHGILIYRESEGRIVRPKDRNARECRVMSILFSSSASIGGTRSLVVGTENDGLKRYSIEDDELTPLNLSNVPYDTRKWKVHNLMQDSQGNLWVSAYQTGLMIVPRSMFGFRHYSIADEAGTSTEGVCLTSICHDREAGYTWIGSDGNGLYRVQAGGGSVNLNSENSGLPDNSVMGVAMDRRGTLWIATFMEGLITYTPARGFRRFKEADRIGTNKTYCLNYDEENDLMYVGTHGKGVMIVDAAAEKLVGTLSDELNNWINTLVFDRSGRLWIATFDGHWYYEPQSGLLSRADLGDSGILNARTYSIYESQDGTLWMGTGEGLVRLDRKDGGAKVYTRRDGLSSNVISDILEGDDGSIWVSTSYGLTRIDPATGKCSRYYAYDGLLGNEFRANASYKSARGQLFFGGVNGLTAFYPQVVDRRHHDIPPVFFTRLTVANQDVEFDPGSETNILDKDIREATAMVLPYSTNSFSLEYAVPEFTNPERVRYAYRLSRFDDEWKTVAANRRSATYTNIPHGRYTLTVKAYFDGDEDNFTTREIGVRVLPPWYLTFWAFLAYAAVLLCFLALLRDLAKKNLRAREEKEALELNAMKIRMFTSISNEIRTPLNLVMSPLEKLREKDTDEERRESYEMMYRNSLKILQLTNRFTDVNRMENGSGEKLEIIETEDAAPAQEDDAEGRNIKSRKNIILVDDNAEMRRYLKMELGKTFNVEICPSADEAWKKICGTIPDAVVTDIIVGGGMDGAELCGKIKRNPSTNLIPVLILSSQWDDETLRRCTESGADRYLVKPVTASLLRSTIQQAITTRETIRNKYTADVSYDFEEITMPSNDGKFLTRIIDLIKVHLDDPGFGVEELSREVGMSRVHLNRKLKETINVSPGNFIKSIRLKQAAYLLVNNKVNISEVAFKVGFSTHSYFSSTFKEYFGLTPKEFILKYSDPAKKDELDRLLKI